MIKKLLCMTFLLCVFVSPSLAQDFKIPNYSFVTAEDYDTYEQDIVAATNWLLKTPINSQKAKRKQVQAFLLKWLEGSPKISMKIKPEIVTFLEASPESFMIYLGGWASYCIEHKDYKNDLKGNVRGIENVISFYDANKKALGKIKAIERYKKLQKKGKLERHLKAKL